MRCSTCNRFSSTGICLRCRRAQRRYPECGHIMSQFASRCLRCYPICANCRRQHTVLAEEHLNVEVANYMVDDLGIRGMRPRSFKLFALAQSQEEVFFCVDCHAHLTEDAAAQTPGRTWPSFVWSLLGKPSTAEKTWSFLPPTWRLLWEASYARHHGVTLASLERVPSLFVDVSDDLKRDKEALTSLSWAGLMRREESLVLPTVRCAAGCSEFKHKANELPFDIVWEHLLGVDVMPLLTKGADARSFTSIFREDYLEPTCIMFNPMWICKATVAIADSNVPVVLCCRHHSKGSGHQFIHVPRHPTGCISSNDSGSISPVVPVPRTVQKSKLSSYSASFQMAVMEGSYYGMDTMYLATNKSISSQSSPLAWQQDLVTYACRRDIRAHVAERYGRMWNEPGCVAACLDRQARTLYPNPEAIKSTFGIGSTFVPMNDAVQAQYEINFGGPETGYVLNDDMTIKSVQFVGAYPKRLLLAHPIGNGRGARPFRIPSFSSQAHADTREVWLLASMMLCVPEVWERVANLPGKCQWEWEGSLLTFLTKKSLDHVNPRSTGNNPFPKSVGEKSLVAEHFRAPVGYDCRELAGRFYRTEERFCDMYAYDDILPDVIPSDAMVLLVTRDYNRTTHANSSSPPFSVSRDDGRVFKLCYIAYAEPEMAARNANHWNGRVYSRYSSSEFDSWWLSRRGSYIPTPVAEPDIVGTTWDVCVYVAVDSHIPLDLRDTVLESCGGQSRAYCSAHKYPLITSPKMKPPRWVCRCGEQGTDCNNEAMYKCVELLCTACICKVHYRAIDEARGKFFVGRDHCFYGPRPALENEEEAGLGRASFFDDHNSGQVQRDVEQYANDDDIPPLIRGMTSDDDDDDDFDETLQAFRVQDSWDAQVHNNGDDSDDDSDLSPRFVALGEDDDEAFEAHFRLSDIAIDENFVTHTAQGVDDYEDIEAIDPADIEAINELDDLIPTTNSGAAPVYTAVVGDDYTGHTASNHVLLNNYGHMLIRRNARLTGTLNQRHFLQRLVARSPGGCIPLVYPEAMVFSNIFYLGTDIGEAVGAVPAALLNSDTVLNSLGFASLQEHYRARLSDPSLSTSTNPKYHLFAFDCLANLGLRGCDSRVVLSRGFAEMQGKGGVAFRGSKDRIFDMEQVDSRPIVNKLAAAIIDKPPTYFYTHTCSMKTHYGMKILWDWLAGEEIMTEVLGEFGMSDERSKTRRNIIDAAGVLLLRAWMEVIYIWVNYITNSPERPIGRVIHFLFRMELQDAKANLPHLHSMLWTDDDLTSPTGMATVLDRIRGSIGDIIRPDERQRYIDEGIFSCNDDFVRFQAMAASFLVHRHTRRCFVLKRKRDAWSDSADLKCVCKANDNFAENPWPSVHSFVDLPIKHSAEAEDVLVALGLARKETNGKFEPLHESLRPVKHYPPAHGNEGIIQPVFGALMARNPNMSNVQFPTGYTLSRYLAKYIVTIDKYNTINISAPKANDDPETFVVRGEQLPNQKITSNRMLMGSARSGGTTSRMPKSRQARAFNVVEFYMLLFDHAPVMTNIEFVKVVTRPFEDRASVERQRPYDRIQRQHNVQHRALTAIDCIPSHFARLDNHLPRWRKFTPTQLSVIEDDLQSPLSTTQVTTFSARPPELMFVAQQRLYRKWFTEQKQNGAILDMLDLCKTQIKRSLQLSMWIDGFSSIIKVRKAAVTEVLEFLRQRDYAWFLQYPAMIRLFTALQVAISAPDPTALQKQMLARFVSEMNREYLPVVWFDTIRPTRTSTFLVHILLSMGHIKDEYDVFTVPSLRESFVKAGLLDPGRPEESARELLHDYVKTQLVCLPSGTNTFDKYLLAAYHTILELFVHDRLHSLELPTVLYCHSRQSTEDKIVAYQRTKQEALVRYILEKLSEAGVQGLPSENDVNGATLTYPCPWSPTATPKPPAQPQQSYEEQGRVLDLARTLIGHYKSARPEYTKGICHVGAGGVGKTTVLLMELLYAACQGLRVGITAMLSERAQELSGSHLHEMFGFPARDVLTPGQLAERGCSALYRNPSKLEFLRTLDVLALDEAGAIPCEILAAMCTVLRYIRNTNKPYGGMLILATMDYLQIDPVSGRHSLLSPTFTSCLFFKELLHSVRAAGDINWQRLQQITRYGESALENRYVKARFVRLLTTTCTFIRSLDDPLVPRNILFVFGKKAPIRKEEKCILTQLQAQRNANYIISHAVDEERTIDGNFRPASDITSRALDKAVKEPRRLVFFRRGRYQITYNKQGQFSNSQLAVLFELPSPQVIASRSPIKLLVAPPGSRFIPDETVTEQQLIAMGWTERSVACPRTSTVHNAAGSVRGRRHQYGLRHHVGSTIHGIMGQTLASMVTRVEPGDKKMLYSLWLASQVVVLLSRTRRGRDTFFWLKPGQQPCDVAEALYDVLLKTSVFRAYLTRLLKSLCGTIDAPMAGIVPYIIDHGSHVIRPRDVPLPSHRLGYVYLLVSTRHLNFVYIGSTYDLVQRRDKHNMGFAATQTAPTWLRPWAVLAYVVGFDGSKPKFVMFECKWIRRKDELGENGQRATVRAIMNAGQDLVQEHNRLFPGDNLRFVNCGTVSHFGQQL